MDELNAFIIDNNIPLNKQNILKKLYDNNNVLLKNLNCDFVNSDYFDRFDFNLLQAIVSLEETVQLDFLKIVGDKRELFYQLVDRFSKEYYQFPYVNALLVNFNNSKFDDFLSNIDINTLTDDDLLNISYILTAKENSLEIKTIYEIRNIDNILDQKIADAMHANNLDDYKNYMLLKKVNLSFPELRLICQKYCYDLDHFHIKDSMIDVLKTFKSIALSTSFEETEQLIGSLNIGKMAYPNFQTLCQNLYEKEFNSVLFDPTDMEYRICEGCKVVDAGDNFNMLIRSNGAFSGRNSSLSPCEYWNSNDRKTLNFSNSLLSNGFLRNISFIYDNVYIFGFSMIPRNCMVQCSMGDDATLGERKKTLDCRSFTDEKPIKPNTGDGCGQQFRPMTEMMKHAAGEIQEVTLERFYYDGDDEYRIQPSYVLYFKINDDYERDGEYRIALEAAKSFDIPLVIIDVKRVVLNEKKNIEKLMTNELTIDNIIEVISRYSNLISSFSYTSDKTANILSDVLEIGDSGRFIEQLLNNYLLTLKSKNYDRSFYQELFDRLMILYDEKHCFTSPKILIKMMYEYNLTANFEKYGDIIFGVTYKNMNKKIVSCYLFNDVKAIFDYILENNLILTDEVYSNVDITYIVRSCRSNNIPLTQDILYYNRTEFEKYMKLYKTRKMVIESLNEFPTEESIENLFDYFSIEEIKPLLHPLIDMLISSNKYNLLKLLKEKLVQVHLENEYVIEYEEPQTISYNIGEFDWDNWDVWDEDVKEHDGTGEASQKRQS